MAYASVTYTSASGTTFALTNNSGDPIPYLKQSDISVTVNGVVLTQGTQYTFNTAGTAVVLATAVSGATVIINRLTDIADPTVVYTAGSTLTAQDLNNADNQIRYGLQEFSDTYAALTSGTGDLQTLGGFIGSGEAWSSDNAHAATTAAIDTRVDGKIDTALTTDVVAGDSITVTDNSPGSGQITIGVTNASISTAKLVDSSVTTAKIADSNVTTVKIANSNVTTAKIADANVTTVKIADGNVTETKIANSAVTAAKIADSVITTAKLTDATVVTAAEQVASTPNDTSFFTTSASDTRYVNATGDTMSGALAMGSNKITGLGTPTASSDATTKSYVDNLVAAATLADADYGDITVSGTGTVWTIDTGAVTSAKIANDTIVDADINSAAAIAGSKISPNFGSQTIQTTGVFSHALGTNGAPTVTFTGDTNTGIYSPGADQVAITTGGTGRLFVDSSGRVGLGITAPAATAHVGGSAIISNVDLANATYDSVSFSVAGQEITPNGLFFSPDGRKMFIAGNTGDDITEYTLSTPWVVSSAAHVTQFSVASQDNGPTDLYFRNDGKKLYVVGNTNDTIYQYTLSVPWSVSSATYDSVSFSVTAQESSPTSLWFKPDGLAMYIVGTTSDTVHRYNLSTAWDVSTATFANSFGVSGQEGLANALTFTADGSRMFVMGTTGDDVNIYNLTTPWDITTASFVTVFSVATQVDAPTGLFVKPDGTKFYIVDFTNDTVYQYSIPSATIDLTGTTAINGSVEVAQDLLIDGQIVGVGGLSLSTADTGATPTERMRITSAGNVGIGTTSPLTKIDSLVNTFADDSTKIAATFRNNQNSGVYSVWQNSNTGTTFGDGLHIGLSNTSNGIINLKESADLQIQTASTERARIDSSGRLLVGTSSALPVGNSSSALQIADSLGYQSLSRWVAAASGPGFILGKSRSATPGSYTIVQNNDDLGSIFFVGDDGTDLVSVGARISCQVDGTPGANDMPGRLVFSTTADGASSPTEQMRITSVGDVFVGTTTSTPASFNGSSTLTGSIIFGVGSIVSNRADGLVGSFNRLTSDGVIISLRQAGTEEGTISVSGTTVSYNGAHLSRWSQIPGIDPYDKTVRPEILRGTVMSNLDEMCDWTCPESGDCQDNEQLNKTKISDVEGDKNVAGIFQSWDDDDDTWVNDFYLAMTGDFVIRIAAGMTVERGDLLMSAGDGTAKPQDDDIIRSKTIAKVTSTNVSCTYDDGSYCVPCVLMAC